MIRSKFRTREKAETHLACGGGALGPRKHQRAGLPSGQRGALTLGLVVAAVYFELVLTTDFVVEV